MRSVSTTSSTINRLTAASILNTLGGWHYAVHFIRLDIKYGRITDNMGSNPINLAVRFFLELTALVAMSFWGWNQGVGVLRFVLAFGIPVIAAAIWVTFAVPNDPSRSGKAPVSVSGILRLILELIFFSFATWTIYSAGATTLSWVFGIVILAHYILSYDRLHWLIKQ
jgi:hypothetical protein